MLVPRGRGRTPYGVLLGPVRGQRGARWAWLRPRCRVIRWDLGSVSALSDSRPPPDRIIAGFASASGGTPTVCR